MSTYTSSRKYYAEPPKIVQSRGSSSDSRGSSDSGASAEQRRSTTSRTSMGYQGGSQSRAAVEPKIRKYRDPYARMESPIEHPRITTYKLAENKYVEGTSRGGVEVINHRQRRYDPDEPRASQATSDEYTHTARREERERRHNSFRK
jgi:hypothetical protein